MGDRKQEAERTLGWCQQGRCMNCVLIYCIILLYNIIYNIIYNILYQSISYYHYITSFTLTHQVLRTSITEVPSGFCRDSMSWSPLYCVISTSWMRSLQLSGCDAEIGKHWSVETGFGPPLLRSDEAYAIIRCGELLEFWMWICMNMHNKILMNVRWQKGKQYILLGCAERGVDSEILKSYKQDLDTLRC